MNNYIIGFIILVFLIYTHYLYWKSSLSSNEKFKSLINIWVSTSLFISMYSVHIQTNNYRDSQAQIEINNFNNLFANFFDSISQLFISNPSLNYYYNELYHNISKYEESDRNITLEKEISTIILSKMENIINFIDLFNNNINMIGQIEQKLLKILKIFFKSKIFLENWNMYKDTFAIDWTIQYINMKFNL